MITNVKSLLLTASLAIFTTACSTLNPKEIQNLNRVAFAPLELRPSVEPTDLRLDVIRQQTQYYIGNDLQTMDVPDDPLGFDLGNGLFYDLNQNFSLRLDRLLDYASDEPFALRELEVPLPNQGYRTYTFASDSLMRSNSEKRRTRYLYHRVGPPDSVSYMNGNALKYVIVRRDSSLACRNKRKVKKEIFTVKEGHFTFERGRREADFVQKKNEIDLQSSYLVTLTDANKTMTIYRLNRKGRRFAQQTIIRGRDVLYVFDGKLRGQKIVFENGGISVFRNENLVVKYELATAKQSVETSMVP
ncbi:hypothetical protein [Persicitalea sp.]|uniref:hypothetical protein n=1 Tax=Persicitalea sp. TaxID=3100273 RepID=UPI003593E270